LNTLKSANWNDTHRHAIENIVGASNVLAEVSDCWVYGYDNSRRHAPPDAVAFPNNADQISALVKYSYKHNIPIVARGRGTGTTGAAVPTQHGLVLAFERMDATPSIDPDNRVMVCQPGVLNQTIQTLAASHGFFWPPDPTSAAFCTLGGNLAFNSAGPRAVKYGTPRENTLGLRCVDGLGRPFKTGVYTTKGVVGYDITRLIIGSEGTLAIITEATLKLTPLPEAKCLLQLTYHTVESAARAVSAIMAQPYTPCALEFIDSQAIDMIRRHAATELPQNISALLLVEVDGDASLLANAAQKILAAARNEGLASHIIATAQTDMDALWATRKALSPALRNLAPKKINEDVVVPVANIPRLLSGLQHLAQQYNITIVNFGHAGNGNIHVNLLVDPENSAQMQRAEHCLASVFALVLQLNGTLSGEHGVGLEKRPFVALELDPVSLQLMHAIKQQFDPKGILNPGKLLPTV
jgi:D-lactate dehydrogenase (quinone)